MAEPIWFWQRIVSPHMAPLVSALAAQGRDVTYVAEEEMSADRARQGWRAPSLGGARLRYLSSIEAIRETVRDAPVNSIHICQGLRGNGLVGEAQKALAKHALRQWTIMETVEDRGWRGVLRRMEYRRLSHRSRSRLEGVLAIGDTTADWLVARGMPSEHIFPFSYFLSDRDVPASNGFNSVAPFRFLYVGRFIEGKRIDLLIDALAALSRQDFEVVLAGSGPLEGDLRIRAEEKLANRVQWLGRRSIGEIPAIMASADCLVLPSRHDGWGAVVSEALMVGTPAICSDACGSAGVVRASGRGGVFQAEDKAALSRLLSSSMAHGRQTSAARRALAIWAQRLGANVGADYLQKILAYSADKTTHKKPNAPWFEEGKGLEVL